MCKSFLQILKGALGMVAPDVEIDDGKGMIALIVLNNNLI